jgi:transposase
LTIPLRRDRLHGGPFDREVYRSCNRVEQLSNRLKQYRRIVTRYEMRVAPYQAMLTVTAVVVWL